MISLNVVPESESNVHEIVLFVPWQRLVKACGETKAAPTEKEEIEFLCTVCAKIKTDPYLVNFFIEVISHSFLLLLQF